MTDPVQTEAYAVACVAAVADACNWTMIFRTDGTIGFDPPKRQSDATRRGVRARLLIAQALGPVDFLGTVDDDGGSALLDAAAAEVAEMFGTEADLARFLADEGKKVRNILSDRASQIDALAAMFITANKSRRH